MFSSYGSRTLRIEDICIQKPGISMSAHPISMVLMGSDGPLAVGKNISNNSISSLRRRRRWRRGSRPPRCRPRGQWWGRFSVWRRLRLDPRIMKGHVRWFERFRPMPRIQSSFSIANRAVIVESLEKFPSLYQSLFFGEGT